jgi:hypothetical protein
MSAPKSQPAKAALLFPDPVIEYYMERVDRAAIRERLKMTPEERLEALQREVNGQAAEQPPQVREERAAWRGMKSKIDLGTDPAWFAAATAVPLLVPDPVIEAYLEDVDRGLIRQAVRLSVPERFYEFLRLTEGAYALRRACTAKEP